MRSQNYSVKIAMFTQPATFSIKLSSGDDAAAIAAQYPPNTSFVLKVNGQVQYEGWTDGYDVTVDTNGTSLEIKGRDILAPIHDSQILKDTSFTGLNASQIVEMAVKETGLNATVSLDVSKARKTRSGYTLIAYDDPPFTAKQAARLARAFVNETWYNFIHRHLEHSGLFLWAAPNKELIISKPDPNKAATYVLRRSAGEIVSVQRRVDTTKRFAEVYVYARGSTVRKTPKGLHDYKGMVSDPEMKAWGFSKLRTFRDSGILDDKGAELYAQRKLAQLNRSSMRLTYTVIGHSGNTVDKRRAVWTPDMMVQVEDPQVGISGKYWIESVEFRSPPSLTVLELIRPQDMTFGSDEP